ncbi:hypothetical protein FIBSPDRAFT_879795 [Athelia psychrophila]|uniref:Uncharacterized protein n=1 Tax=Athelia psychrophila TaxID=1759441 RepID=A0A167TKT2_9AGAM|nr:hypothetical protein FIBSPDRAFT_879795 [Fibularhizoctonia sp. CBS 109695]
MGDLALHLIVTFINVALLLVAEHLRVSFMDHLTSSDDAQAQTYRHIARTGSPDATREKCVGAGSVHDDTYRRSSS